MKPINMIVIYCWHRKLKKNIAGAGSWYNNNWKNNIDLMSFVKRMHFLEDVFQITAIALVLFINHHHIYGVHLLWCIFKASIIFVRFHSLVLMCRSPTRMNYVSFLP